MPSHPFQLKTVARLLSDGVALAEAIHFPEISALDDAGRKWRASLLARARTVLADPVACPAVSLHRRASPPSGLETDFVELTFEPARRSAAWQEPVKLTVHYVHWTEENQHHAFVPVLGLRVFAPRADQLPQRVDEHVRLMLSARRTAINLAALAELGRVTGLELDELDLTVQRKTPRQVESEANSVGTESSVLPSVAEELPPTTSTVRVATKTGPGAAAYEVEAELASLAQALAGPPARSILMVGPPGCGKTALVRELARQRATYGFGVTPFWSTSAARLMTGPMGFGMWQQRCQDLCRELAKARAILHLGNLADLLEVGKTSRLEQSVGGFLRPWIARGEVLAVAECHPDQLGAIERSHPALLGAFQQMPMAERTPDQTLRVLEAVLEESPGRPVPAGDRGATSMALRRLQRLHLRYATYSANPGRPLRFLKNLLADTFPEKQLTEGRVIRSFSRETGLPLMLLDDDIPFDLNATREWFAGRVLGQPEAVAQVLDLLATIKAGLGRPRKPLASLLLIGPTGTGKTELAKALASFLFGDVARLVRFDLNEFNDPVSVQRLIGGPAAGQAEGLLTARVREQPFSVILLDEFEKADPAFFDLLLQVLGDGRLTDAAGRVADFCNSVIVMTSNLGAQEFQRGPLGFRQEPSDGPDGAGAREAGDHFAAAVRKFLRPEIYNRLDAIVPFRGLTRNIVRRIAAIHLEQLRQRDGLRLRGVECTISPDVADWLAERGYDARYGARPLKRAIERELIVPLAEALNQYTAATPLRLAVSAAEARLRIEAQARPTGESFFGETGSGSGHGVELVRAVVAVRRSVMRLRRCEAVSRLDDDLILGTSLQRRSAAAKWTNPDLAARFARLPALRTCLQSLEEMSSQASGLETEVLTAWYRREAPEPELISPELSRLEQTRRRLLRDVFRLNQDAPDEVTLALFGEPRELGQEFGTVLLRLADRLGRIEALDYFLPPPTGRRGETQGLLRESAKQPADFPARWPEKVVGIVFRVRGDLVRARLGPEAGLHVFRERSKERVCLVQEVGAELARYEPPKGIDRPGAIRALDVALCRTYELASSSFRDESVGRREWVGLSLEQALSQLIEDRLAAAMERLIQWHRGPG